MHQSRVLEALAESNYDIRELEVLRSQQEDQEDGTLELIIKNNIIYNDASIVLIFLISIVQPHKFLMLSNHRKF